MKNKMIEIEETRIQTIRIIVDDPDKLLNHAATAARWGNECINHLYSQGIRFSARLNSYQKEERTEELKKKIQSEIKEPFPMWSDNSAPLSGVLRDTMRREAEQLWQKFSRKTLAGFADRLPYFGAKNSLRLRGFTRNKSGINRTVKVLEDGKGWYNISLQLYPGRDNNWVTFPIYKFTEKKKLYTTEWLEKCAKEKVAFLKVTLVFDKRNKSKVLVRLTYDKKFSYQKKNKDIIASIGPQGKDGELYLRVPGPAYTYMEHRRLSSITHFVQQLQNLKKHSEGIYKRLRLSKKRRVIKKLRGFEDKQGGIIHQLSNAIIQFLKERKATKLEWRIKHDGELPWHDLYEKVKYKGHEIGLEVIEEHELTEKITQEDYKWTKQVQKNLREIQQATRKM